MSAQSGNDKTRAPRALGVIPARGGSKRLPRKNILPVGGHPLIAHTIMAAANARCLSDWLVTSDDDEIIEIAKQYGAPVPFKRPAELGGDEVRNIDTVRHALLFLENEKKQNYDIVVLLQPTCPIRDPAHIDEAVNRLWQSDLDTLASVKGPFKKRDPVLKAIRNQVLEPYVRDEPESANVEPFYIYNASLYAARRDYFLRAGKLISRRQVPLVMDQYHSVDVDEASDLLVVEAYMQFVAQQKKGLYR
jgi:CMP-N,N'-diacetyllegionaminic acid synthase